MSRLILLLVLAGIIAAAAIAVVSVFSSEKTSNGTGARVNGIQKVAFGVLLALMFAMSVGALGDV